MKGSKEAKYQRLQKATGVCMKGTRKHESDKRTAKTFNNKTYNGMGHKYSRCEMGNGSAAVMFSTAPPATINQRLNFNTFIFNILTQNKNKKNTKKGSS